MFFDNLVFLCNEKKTSPNAVCIALGLSPAAATKWRTGAVPRETTLLKIAEYFGVTTSYLLGETAKEKSPPFITDKAEDERLKQTLLYLEKSGVIKFTEQNKPTENSELVENTIIWHRDGKTERRQFTKEQMDMIDAMLKSIPDTPKDI